MSNTEMDCHTSVLPENSVENFPGVKFREKKYDSEAERKRRSKNRLSNRRSTGYVSPEDVEQAKRMSQAAN